MVHLDSIIVIAQQRAIREHSHCLILVNLFSINPWPSSNKSFANEVNCAANYMVQIDYNIEIE